MRHLHCGCKKIKTKAKKKTSQVENIVILWIKELYAMHVCKKVYAIHASTHAS
jgi:hypothetical protein